MVLGGYRYYIAFDWRAQWYWGHFSTFYDGPWYQFQLGPLTIGAGPHSRLAWWLDEKFG